MVPSLASFVWLSPQKGEKLIQSESCEEYSEDFHYYITFTYSCIFTKGEKTHILFPPLIISLKASFVRNMRVEFQDYAKVFLPSDIQIRMAFCKIFKRCFLPPSPLLLPKYSSYLLSGASKLSPQQEHQREQVNHLALTPGADTFQPPPLFFTAWDISHESKLFYNSFGNIFVNLMLSLFGLKKGHVLWILKMHSCERCVLWPRKVWSQHHQGQS